MPRRELGEMHGSTPATSAAANSEGAGKIAKRTRAKKPAVVRSSTAGKTAEMLKVAGAARRGGRRRVTTRPRAAALMAITVSPAAGPGYAAEGPVTRVVDALGNNVVADILGVARSQPSRWRSGVERLSPENRKRISDLDHVLDRLLLELYPDQAGLWLTGPNPHLGGARPIDVLELRGAAAVLPAIDALAAGAFA